jgi:hypothetical protein
MMAVFLPLVPSFFVDEKQILMSVLTVYPLAALCHKATS